MQHSDRHLLQIYYNEATKSALDPDLTPLDNTNNPRPDWYEIWPILDYFQQNEINDNDWYGFFSPRLRQKTKITGKKLHAWIDRYGTGHDVIVFSQRLKPKFKNVFEQGERTHPGLTELTQQCLDEISLNITLEALETRGAKAVFSNYFVARGSFWRKWLGIAQALVDIAENPQKPLSQSLNLGTFYRTDTPPVAMKVFIAERIASMILGMDESTRVIAKRPIIYRKLLPRLIRKKLEKPRETTGPSERYQ